MTTKEVVESKNEETGLVEVPEYMIFTPDFSKEVIEENIGESLSVTDLMSISVPSGGGTTWEFVDLDGSHELKELEGIIIYWKDVRAYWEKKFDGDNSPPDCFSDDNKVGAGDPGGPCVKCPYSKFDTADGGKGAGQACKQIRLVFMVRESDMLPFVVRIPPTSYKGMKSYFMQLAGRGKLYHSTISKLTLGKDKSKGGIVYSKVLPVKGADLNAEQKARTSSYSRSMRSVFDSSARNIVEAGDQAGQ